MEFGIKKASAKVCAWRIDPGREISDQYGATNFKINDGTVISGRIMNLTEARYHINTDMMKPCTITYVEVEGHAAIEASPISMMQLGLINIMSKDDVPHSNLHHGSNSPRKNKARK